MTQTLPIPTEGAAQPVHDRVLPATRLLALIVIPFLVVASVLLLIFPTRTGQLFAWPIQPPMTAMMLGSAYLGGIYFFTRVLFARRWHTVQVGFPPVITFASLLGIATLLHWDRFTHNHVSFWAWAGLYFTTPFLVLAALLSNRRSAGPAGNGGLSLHPLARLAFGLVGGVTLLLSLALFIQPQMLNGIWPWKLTPLTARVVGAMFALPGVLGVEFAFTRRWSAMQPILEAQALSILFILISALRDWGSMQPDSLVPYLFVAGLAGLLLGIAVLYGAMLLIGVLRPHPTG